LCRGPEWNSLAAGAITLTVELTRDWRLLQRALAQQQSHPTYYGGVWDALGTALLDTSTFSAC
jgi:hypothetical protein